MKKTMVAVFACALLGGASMAYAQSATGAAGAGDSGMSTHRATAPENNNNPGTTAGTPTHSAPAKSSGMDDSGSSSAGK